MVNKRKIIGKGQYAVGEHQQFIDREGKPVLLTKEYYDAQRIRRREIVNSSLGKAYGFFDCSASKEAIESELPAVRIDTKTPKELELSLMEGMDQLRGLRGVLNDMDLLQIARKAKKDGMRYVIEATYPCATNEKTSGELQALLINTSNSLFCQTDEHIRRMVVYKERGRYVFRK